ncbi:hypothetical protein SAMN05421578_11416 [Paenibacillus macquariensis]|uniref:Uncharacterized protein n=1 Tax=Paenibacillus macquariensis TaxID=948756 RepID=A0ABY1K910_9BACL|nr:hypothetical protein SAMN05421578_11416 [Paenibacillus macquariensis]
MNIEMDISSIPSVNLVVMQSDSNGSRYITDCRSLSIEAQPILKESVILGLVYYALF